MMMVSIDTRNEKIKLTSFMRDMYVAIPGYGHDKLNAAYAYGGPGLTIATLEDNFRVDIDRYVIIDFKKFVESSILSAASTWRLPMQKHRLSTRNPRKMLAWRSPAVRYT